MRSSMTKLRSTKKFEIVLDSNKLKWFYMSCAAALPQLDRGSDYESERHRFESYTPHQLKSKASGNGGFSFTPAPHGFEPRSRRGRQKTRSVFSPRASPPAGGRSRCGSAKRMRGILYAAPIELKASGNGGFSFRQTLHGFEPRSRREQLIYRFVKLFSNCPLTHRGLACIIIRALRRYLSWIEGLTTNQNVIGSNPIRRTN